MMNDDDLVSIVDSAVLNGVNRGTEFPQDNNRAFEYYMGMPFGNEEKNKSKVVSTDVADVIDADMPSLARVFLGAGEVVEFKPGSEKPEDIEEAEEKNIYINYILQNLPHSFKKQIDWLKSIEIYKAGVLEYGIETVKKSESKKYTKIDALELALYLEEFRSRDGVKEVKIVSQETIDTPEGERFNLEVSLISEREEYFLTNVPIEDLILSRNVQVKDEADIVGKEWTKTKGQLVADGFKKDVVKKLATSKQQENTQLKESRFKGQGGDANSTNTTQTSHSVELHWTMEMVSGEDVYVKVDFDEDGVQERRHVIKSGTTILHNETFDHIPYVIASAITMPHNIIGRSRAEITMPTQEIQSYLSRGLINNTAMVNAGRNVVNTNVVRDDLLDVRENAIVRTKGKGPVGNDILPLVVPYVGDKTLQVIQYFDSKRAQSTGALLANQGLQGDDLYKETATRFKGVENASKAKVELVGRVIAEMGYKELYEGLAWFANHFQDDEKEIFVLGKTLTVDPKKWRFEHKIQTLVGTGAGDDEQALQNLSGWLAIQEQLLGRGSLLVDDKKIYNVAKRMAKIMGQHDVTQILNDPEIPAQILQAENEQLKAAVEQFQANAQNPLAEAEAVKVQGQLALGEQKLINSNAQFMAELEQKQQQFMATLKLEVEKLVQGTANEMTKLEVDSGQNVPGSRV